MDIGSLTGAIIIGDQFSSVLTMGISKIESFVDRFDGMTKDVLVGSGVVIGAIAGITTAIVALGERGSEINNVSNTLDTFAGSSENAKVILESLRTSTKGTVDDFELMKGAAQVLSAGVKLTATDFGTLGTAAFDLAHRGFGNVSDMMEIVDRAMITGRTRQLAMKLGVVDNANALDEYAHKLGLAKDELTKTQTTEATRITILNMMQDAIKKTGEVQMTFADTITAGIVKVKNWADEIAQAVDRSPDVRRALDAIGEGFRQVFGSEAKTMQELIIDGVNTFARSVTAAVPYVVSLANGIKSIGQFIVANKPILEDATKAVIAFSAGWAVWTYGEALVASLISGLTAVTTSVTVMTTAVLANPFTVAAVAAVAAGSAISLYAQSTANAALVTQEAGAKADAAAAATKRLAAAHDTAKVAVAAAAPVVAEHSKAVDALVDSFFKAQNSMNATTPAFNLMTQDQRDNYSVQKLMLPLFDQMIAAGVPLTLAETNYYNKVLDTRTALVAKNAEMLAAKNITLQDIETLKLQGLSQAEIAFRLGTTIEGLQRYQTTLKNVTDFEQQALKMSTEMWREYTDTVTQLTNTEYQNKYAAIEKWAEEQSTKIDEQAKKMTLAGQDTTDFLADRYSELATTITAKYQASFLDVKQIQDANQTDTLRGLRETAEARKRDLDFALTMTGTWSDATIEKIRATYKAAEDAVTKWGTTSNDVYQSNADWIDSLVDKQRKLKEATDAATEAQKAAKSTFTLVGTPVADKFKNMSHDQLVIGGLIDPMGHVTMKGQSEGLGNAGSGMNSFDVGGPVIGDQIAKIHDGEYIVPSGGTLVMGGSTPYLVSHLDALMHDLADATAKIASAVSDGNTKAAANAQLLVTTLTTTIESVTAAVTATPAQIAVSMGQGSASAEQVAKASGQGSATAAVIAKAMGQGSATAEQIAKASGQGSATAAVIAKAMGQGSATADVIAKAMGQGSATAEQVAKAMGQGSATADEIARAMGNYGTSNEFVVPSDDARVSGSRSDISVTIAPGAVVQQYPIVNDKYALQQLGGPLAAAVIVELRSKGIAV